MFNIFSTYLNKPSNNLILKKLPIMGILYIFSVFLYDLFRFLSRATPMKIVLIMAMHGVPGILNNSFFSEIDVNVLLVYLLIFTFFSMLMCSVLIFITAKIKKKIISNKVFASLKNRKLITNNIFDLDIISYFILFLLFFIILNFIDSTFAILVLSITFFIIFFISLFLKFLKMNLKNKLLLKIQKKVKSQKIPVILAVGDIFLLIMFIVLIIFYFFFNLTDGFHLIISIMMMRRIGRCIQTSFSMQLKIISHK